jgi:hypothetical protein
VHAADRVTRVAVMSVGLVRAVGEQMCHCSPDIPTGFLPLDFRRHQPHWWERAMGTTWKLSFGTQCGEQHMVNSHLIEAGLARAL